MKMMSLMTALMIAGVAGNAMAADAKPTSVGGGVKNPWTSPYTVAIVVPEPASIGLLGMGGAWLLTRRRRAQ